MKNVSDTILAQYSNSQTLIELIERMNDAIDPSINIDAIYSSVFDIETCGSYGLDCWGKIVGISREIDAGDAAEKFFGFSGSGLMTLNNAPFWDGGPTYGMYTLPDAPYRKLIIAKAMANVCDCSIKNINALLRYLFGERCYCLDDGGMGLTLVYTFEFLLSDLDKSILNSGVIPHPAGVGYRWEEVISDETFGFDGSDGVPFDQGVFAA